MAIARIDSPQSGHRAVQARTRDLERAHFDPCAERFAELAARHISVAEGEAPDDEIDVGVDVVGVPAREGADQDHLRRAANAQVMREGGDRRTKPQGALLRVRHLLGDALREEVHPRRLARPRTTRCALASAAAPARPASRRRGGPA